MKIGAPSTSRVAGSSFRRGAETSTRDARAPRILLATLLILAAFSPSRATEPDTFSPVVSYQYLDTLAEPGTTITSPVVSYQYFDWLGDENVTFTNSREVSFYFLGATHPAIVTVAADNILATAATLNGEVNPLGQAVSASFEWGVSPNALTNRTAGQDVGTGGTAVAYRTTLSGLKAGTTYYFRARRESFGTGVPPFGQTLSFLAAAAPPKTAPKVSVTARGVANERTQSAAYFKFRRTGDLSQPLTVFFTLSGTAIHGADYDPQDTFVTFPAGSANFEIAIVPRADGFPEVRERITLTLLESTAYQTKPGPAVAHRDILDEALAGPPISLPPARSGGLARSNFVRQPILALNTADRWFRVDVPEATTLNVSVTGNWKATKDEELDKSGKTYAWLAAHLGVELVSPRGVVLSAKERQPIINDGVVYYPSQGLRRIELKEPGVYYVRIYKASDEGRDAFNPVSRDLWYLVSLSSGPFWDLLDDSIPNSNAFVNFFDIHNPAGEVHHIGFIPLGKSGVITSRRPTWIVSHGRESSWKTFETLGLALAKPAGWKPGNISPQILFLDWVSAAATNGPGGGATLLNGHWFPDIGAKLGDLLLANDDEGPRFASGDLRMVGHSWGTYVNFEVAERMQSKTNATVRRMVALDPAQNATNYRQQDVSFAGVSDYSLSFRSSPFGSRETAASALDTFDIDSGLYAKWPWTKHSVAWQLFQGILKDTDPISSAFRDVLLRGEPNPLRLWAENPRQLTTTWKRGSMPTSALLNFPPDWTGFEGEINAKPGGAGYLPEKLLYHGMGQ